MFQLYEEVVYRYSLKNDINYEMLIKNKKISLTFIDTRHCLDSGGNHSLRHILMLHSFVVLQSVTSCIAYMYYALAKSLIIFAPFTMVSEMIITIHN